MKKIGKIVGNVLVTVILVFSILMTVMVLSSTKHESGLPNLFGKAIFNVLTDSMMSEEGFPEGSLIIVELTDTTRKEPYKVGDVVTFWRYYEDQAYLETHRIVADTYTQNQNEVVDGIWVHGGEYYYVTRGDNTPDIDMNQDLSIDYLSNQRIVAKWTGTAIPHLGSILSFLQSQLGFMLCVVIPTAIFFFFELFKFISTLMDAKKEKAVAAVKEAEEEIKQRVMAEMLAAQGAAARGDNTPDIDMNQDLSIDYLSNQRIVAKWTGTAIPHLGSILSFLQSQLGFMLCVVIPTAIFFFFELFKFISTLMDAKKEKAVAAVKEAEEEIKQRVMAEMLAAQGAAAPAEAVKAAEEKPKPVEETKKPEEIKKSAESEDDIKKKAVEEYIAKQEAEKAAAAKAAEEEEIKRKAVEEYIKQQEAEKAAAEQAAKEEELKKQAIAEYLAQQEAEKNASEETAEETTEE